MMDAAVTVSNLTLRRGDRTLFEKMRWHLPHGKILAVTGRSGIGKSSLLGCLGGFVNAAEGDVKLGPDGPRSVGFVFQSLRLTQNLSVLTNVLCGKLGEYAWWQTLFSFTDSDRQAAYGILVDLGLEQLVYRRVRNISGGEQQRTAVARVLLQNPAVMLADEPTSDLDAQSASRVLSLIRSACTTENRTAICILHDREAVKNFADYELTLGEEYENGWNFRKISK